MSLDPAALVRANASCLLTELGDGTGVLLDLATKFYFTLNDTGVFVWKALVAREAASVATLAEALSTEFAVDESTAAADTTVLVDELLRAGLCSRTA